MYSLALRTSILPFRTRRIAESTVMDELPGEPAVEPVSPDDFDDRLFKFFQRLGNTDRSILVLLMEGYNNKEIGTMLKLSQDAVAQRISRVRKSITNN
jgi:DNA-directed RNA polymerase specialized sigma24 family protein